MSSHAQETKHSRWTLKHFLRVAIPVAITVIAIYFIVRDLEFGDIGSHLNARSIGIFVPALLSYGFVSLVLEGLSLKRPMHGTRKDFTFVTAARLKAASYLVGIVHIAAGAGTLAYLLRKQAGVSLSYAMGVVMLMMMFDLGIVLSLVVVGWTMASASTLGLQIGLVPVIIALMIGGFALLRASFSLGPLDRIRRLDLFLAARTIPARELVELALLRFCFVMSMTLFGWAALTSFGISLNFPELLFNFSLVLLAGVLPAVAGVGPSQLAMVDLFAEYGSREAAAACALVFTIGMISMRALIGLAFAGEFSKEAFEAAREADAVADGEAQGDSPDENRGEAGGEA